jgi:hypothetical protein
VITLDDLLLAHRVIDHNGDATHRADRVRATATVIRELPGGWLAALVDGSEVSWVLFRFTSSDADGDLWERLADGEGYAGELRELRHSAWGETENRGYIFYPPLATIAAACEALREWFD